jgi:hypothetical protein
MSPGFLLRGQSLSDEVLSRPKEIIKQLGKTYRLPKGTARSLTPNATLESFLTAAQDRGYTHLPQLLEALRFGSAGLKDELIKTVLSDATGLWAVPDLFSSIQEGYGTRFPADMIDSAKKRYKWEMTMLQTYIS